MRQKRISGIIVLFCLVMNTHGQITFFNTYPFQNLQNCISTSDSGYAHLTEGGNLMKMDKYGDTLWTRQYYIDNSFQEGCIIETHDSGYLIWQESNIGHGR